MSDIKLKVENITKSFGDEVAVDDLSFEVERGQLKSLLGPSGCGKTTTLRCIAGLETPDVGRIYIGDELVCDAERGLQLPPKQRGIGMVFQSYAIWPHMTVKENVLFPLEYRRADLDSEERDLRAQRILKNVGLGAHIGDLASQLSGGQQQRVALSRALVVEPEILLMDEPLSNLDAKLRREMRKEIQDIYQEYDITVLYVTHSQDEAMFLSDEIAIMNQGDIVEEGTPAELYKNPDTFFGMNFMGRCNTIPGEIVSIGGEGATLRTEIGDIRSTARVDEFQPGDPVDICFRPKFCSLEYEGGDGTAVSTVTASVTAREYEASGSTFDGTIVSEGATRDFTEYELDIQNRQIRARTPEPLPIEIGDMVELFVPADRVRLFPTEDVPQERVQAVTEPANAD